MRSRQLKLAGAAFVGAVLIGLGGCTSDELAMFADAMAEASDEMAVTLTSVPAYGCDYNVDGYLVCDDTGDGLADRYGDPSYEYAGYTVYGVPAYSGPLTRVNGYGEAYVYDTDCSCWAREPSLDELPDIDHHHHDDDWDD